MSLTSSPTSAAPPGVQDAPSLLGKKGRRVSAIFRKFRFASSPPPPAVTLIVPPYSPIDADADTQAPPAPSISLRSSTSSSPLRTPSTDTDTDAAPPASPSLSPSSSSLPPSYTFVAHPTVPATYAFAQVSPFAMELRAGGGAGARTLYHISVGVNVWMPSATVTYLRRAAEDGPVVATLEMGISAGTANVTFADECRALGNVMFRKSAGSSSRYYFTGDGTIIRWKLGVSEWQAYTHSTLLATFSPDSAARALTVQPAANADGRALLDHLVVALLVLMREHLTPAAGRVGDAAGLFNYTGRLAAGGEGEG